MPEYTVKQGDCIPGIAQKFGFSGEKIWNHPNNQKLKQDREDPNVLYPGDVVFIPDKEEKQEPCATGKRHRFRLKGVPSVLRLQIMQQNEPRANESYILIVDNEAILNGATDDDGKLVQRILPNAKEAKLLVGEEQEEYILDLGHLDPIDTIQGVQGRLNNLGFDCGQVDGVIGPKTKSALIAFQMENGLTESGELDKITLEKLMKEHEC